MFSSTPELRSDLAPELSPLHHSRLTHAIIVNHNLPQLPILLRSTTGYHAIIAVYHTFTNRQPVFHILSQSSTLVPLSVTTFHPTTVPQFSTLPHSITVFHSTKHYLILLNYHSASPYHRHCTPSRPTRRAGVRRGREHSPHAEVSNYNGRAWPYYEEFFAGRPRRKKLVFCECE